MSVWNTDLGLWLILQSWAWSYHGQLKGKVCLKAARDATEFCLSDCTFPGMSWITLTSLKHGRSIVRHLLWKWTLLNHKGKLEEGKQTWSLPGECFAAPVSSEAVSFWCPLMYFCVDTSQINLYQVLLCRAIILKSYLVSADCYVILMSCWILWSSNISTYR